MGTVPSARTRQSACSRRAGRTASDGRCAGVVGARGVQRTPRAVAGWHGGRNKWQRYFYPDEEAATESSCCGTGCQSGESRDAPTARLIPAPVNGSCRRLVVWHFGDCAVSRTIRSGYGKLAASNAGIVSGGSHLRAVACLRGGRKPVTAMSGNRDSLPSGRRRGADVPWPMPRGSRRGRLPRRRFPPR